jgi:ABC-type polysaccharide/polyol phosphate transport system ATPase subunit
MNDNVAIEVEHVSKKYCRTLRGSIRYGVKDIARNAVGLSSNSDVLREDEFWALDDVSLEVERGDTLGIMGPNGSGKTTLLKLLNGIFWPDKGRVQTRGRVGALIEVGAGFHPMLTGRENIFVNGAILGMKKFEVEDRLQEIIRFADIGTFIDSPVRTYSSGMFVRLGFAVAVHSEPQILLVDEVLAVGDRSFQLKCFRKMHELKNREDVSVVLVSHNEYAMREFTQKCIVLDRGRMMYSGDSEQAISFYVDSQAQSKSNEIASPLVGAGDSRSRAVDTDRVVNASGGIIRQVIFRDSGGQPVKSVYTGEKLLIDFLFETYRTIVQPIFGISFYNEIGMFTGFWSSYEKVVLPDINGRGCVRVTVDPLDLPVDCYHCDVVVCEEEESNVLEWKELGSSLTVKRPENARGLLKLRQTWEMV